MGIDAVALLKLSGEDKVATSAKVGAAESGADFVALSLGFGFDWCESDHGGARTLLHKLVGDGVLRKHTDTRGILIFPDIAQSRATSYAGRVKDVAESGFWLPVTASADEGRGANWIEKRGGTVLASKESPGCVVINLRNCSLSNDDLEALATMPEAVEINLTAGDDTARLDAKLLAKFAQLPALKKLHLNGWPLRDEHVRAWPAFPALEALDLSGSAISDPGLASLAKHTSLRWLSLGEAPITGVGFAAFAEHGLSQLILGRSRLGDAGLVALAGLKGLKEINAEPTNITDVGIASLAEATSLKKLNLGRTRITDRSLPYLTGLKELRFLRLNSTAITDAGLDVIRKLTSLEVLDLSGTKVTDAGIAKLAVLPNLVCLGILNCGCTLEIGKSLKGIKPLRFLWFTHTGGSGAPKLSPQVKLNADSGLMSVLGFGGGTPGQTLLKYWNGLD